MKTIVTSFDLRTSANSGFSLIELLVAVSITVLLFTAAFINLTGQRSARDLKIAQNELISNLRKIQSYTLASRILPSGELAQYYIMKFDLSTPGQYTIQSISNASSQPILRHVETIKLPPNIFIASTTPGTYPVTVSSRLNPTSQPMYTGCGLAAFVAPFGKIIFNDGCVPTNFASPYTLLSTDSYYAKLINFLTNVACDGNNGNPPGPAVCSASTDSIMSITLSNSTKTLSRKVLINAITGSVCPTQDGTACLATN